MVPVCAVKGEKMVNFTRREALASAIATVSALALGACGNGNAADNGEKTFKIGVLQYVQHPALDAANAGFVKALDESGIAYAIDQQNAQNEQSSCQSIAAKFVGDRVDLILAIATPAAQAALAATSEIPIVGTAITDYAESGLATTNEEPGGNVTGSSDLNPVSDQIEMLLKVVPNAKKVGLLFCSAEANSEIQIKLAEQELDARGVGHDRYTVSSSNEIQSVVESMIGKVDAVYTPTDNVIASGMSQVAHICKEGKLPIICGEENMVEQGGLCTLSIDYTNLGHMAGEMAVEILNGAKPATMAIRYQDSSELKIAVNDETAAAIGVDVSSIKS